MALYFYFNETTGDLVYSDQATYDAGGYTSLGQQTNTHPTEKSHWRFDQRRTSIKTVTKGEAISVPIDVLTSTEDMFSDCNILTSVDLSGFDTSNVTDMSSMFAGCNALISVDLSGFDTSNVTDMAAMFKECETLTSLDLSGFDTSKVTAMGNIFNACRALISLDLSGFDTSKVTAMNFPFNGCSSLRIIDISPNMSNILPNLLGDTYYDAVTRQSYAKAEIPGGSTYVRDLADLDLIATMVQTRMGINVAKRLANKALKKAESISAGVDVVKTDRHQTSYDRDTLEIVVDSTGKVTEMYFVSA